MKKLISLILMLAMLISVIPSSAFAESCNYIEVNREGAPLRESPYEESSILVRCNKGSVLKVLDSCINTRLNKWYKASFNGRTGYIFSGNVDPHKHRYQTVSVAEVSFKVCNCGDVVVNGNSQMANSIASQVSLAAVPLTAVDGPLPFGDLIAAGLVIVGTCYAYNIAVPSTQDLVSMITDADFQKYLDSRDNICGPLSFRLVARIPGGLKYISPKCMDAIEAYVAVRFLKMDVYTAKEENAFALAVMHGSAIMERDKDNVSHFFHYHLGLDRIGGHVFFDKNDLGHTPI